MSLNEAGSARSNLTPKQQHEAMASIYGLAPQESENSVSTSNQMILSDADAEKMRQILAQHDKQNAAAVQEFDLNRPPQKAYVHQPFPKLIYNLTPDGRPVHKLVHNISEHEAAIEAGWANEPVAPAEAEETELDQAAAAEAAAIDKELAKQRAARKKKA